MSGWVRPLVGRASPCNPPDAELSWSLSSSRRFSDGRLRTLQRRMKDWRDIMAKRLVYAASDEHAVEQRFREGSVLVVTGMTGWNSVSNLWRGNRITRPWAYIRIPWGS